MRTCAVLACHSSERYNEIHRRFFKCPKDKERAFLWQEFTCDNEAIFDIEKRNFFICDLHFVEADFYLNLHGLKALKNNAVPSINVSNQEKFPPEELKKPIAKMQRIQRITLGDFKSAEENAKKFKESRTKYVLLRKSSSNPETPTPSSVKSSLCTSEIKNRIIQKKIITQIHSEEESALDSLIQDHNYSITENSSNDDNLIVLTTVNEPPNSIKKKVAELMKSRVVSPNRKISNPASSLDVTKLQETNMLLNTSASNDEITETILDFDVLSPCKSNSKLTDPINLHHIIASEEITTGTDSPEKKFFVNNDGDEEISQEIEYKSSSSFTEDNFSLPETKKLKSSILKQAIEQAGVKYFLKDLISSPISPKKNENDLVLLNNTSNLLRGYSDGKSDSSNTLDTIANNPDDNSTCPSTPNSSVGNTDSEKNILNTGKVSHEGSKIFNVLQNQNKVSTTLKYNMSTDLMSEVNNASLDCSGGLIFTDNLEPSLNTPVKKMAFMFEVNNASLDCSGGLIFTDNLEPSFNIPVKEMDRPRECPNEREVISNSETCIDSAKKSKLIDKSIIMNKTKLSLKIPLNEAKIEKKSSGVYRSNPNSFVKNKTCSSHLMNDEKVTKVNKTNVIVQTPLNKVRREKTLTGVYKKNPNSLPKHKSSSLSPINNKTTTLEQIKKSPSGVFRKNTFSLLESKLSSSGLTNDKMKTLNKTNVASALLNKEQKEKKLSGVFRNNRFTMLTSGLADDNIKTPNNTNFVPPSLNKEQTEKTSSGLFKTYSIANGKRKLCSLGFEEAQLIGTACDTNFHEKVPADSSSPTDRTLYDTVSNESCNKTSPSLGDASPESRVMQEHPKTVQCLSRKRITRKYPKQTVKSRRRLLQPKYSIAAAAKSMGKSNSQPREQPLDLDEKAEWSKLYLPSSVSQSFPRLNEGYISKMVNVLRARLPKLEPRDQLEVSFLLSIMSAYPGAPEYIKELLTQRLNIVYVATMFQWDTAVALAMKGCDQSSPTSDFTTPSIPPTKCVTRRGIKYSRAYPNYFNPTWDKDKIEVPEEALKPSTLAFEVIVEKKS